MRSGVCPECGADVTRALVAEGAKQRAVLLDSIVDPVGRVYVDRWENNQRIVIIKATPGGVPSHIPMRYSLHQDTCKGKP